MPFRGLGSGTSVEIISYQEVNYGNGKMETGEGTNSLETIQRARGDGTAISGYLWSVVSTLSVEAHPYDGDGVGTGHRGV